MEIVLYGLTAFLVVGAALPLLSRDHWAVRVFDFPRVQLAVGMVVVLIWFAAWGPTGPSTYVAMGLLGVSLCYEVVHILPYTALYPCQVLWAQGEVKGAVQVSLLTANVEMENRDSEALLERIGEKNADLVLLLEPDDWWMDQLSELGDAYPHSVKHPRPDAYGMCLYSKYRFEDVAVRFIVEDDVPSIHGTVSLPSDVDVTLHGLHPRPPHPRHGPDTTERDAELLLLARELQDDERPTLVAGDLNDVSWSYTTRLFQNISGLLDPRVGRGLFNTFHARYPLFRYPLDHVFHSDHFTIEQMEVLPDIGSDHFPVYVELQYESEAEEKQATPEADGADEAQADHELEKLDAKRNEQ